MSEKILLHLLIVCGVSCQGIILASSKDDIQESPALLAREKRVVNLEPESDQNISINQAKYMTIISQYNRANCVGIILSHYTVLTASICILYEPYVYRIGCASAHPRSCKNHNVTSAERFYGNAPHQNTDGIALLTIDPPFEFGAKRGSIQLYEGSLPDNTEASIFGWGCQYPLVPSARVTNFVRRLRQIDIPIINRTVCQNIYQHHFRISNKYICTYHQERYCAQTDIGAPLVVNRKLAGIHVYKGEYHGQQNPDVFIDLTLPEYRTWIRHHTLLM